MVMHKLDRKHWEVDRVMMDTNILSRLKANVQVCHNNGSMKHLRELAGLPGFARDSCRIIMYTEPVNFKRLEP